MEKNVDVVVPAARRPAPNRRELEKKAGLLKDTYPAGVSLLKMVAAGDVVTVKEEISAGIIRLRAGRILDSKFLVAVMSGDNGESALQEDLEEVFEQVLLQQQR